MPTSMYLMIIALLLLAIGAASMREWRRHRWAPCRWCDGTGKAYQPGKGRRYWGDCRHCGGTGTRLRAGAKIQGGRKDER
jgi:DnaJ-class molecular chaperone